MGDFKELDVWKRSHALTIKIYEVTNSFPRSEIYGLSQQLRRAAISIEANLAEGCGRKTDRELFRFASISNGSAYEVESELLVALDLGYITSEQHRECTQRVRQVSSMLNGLIRRLQNSASARAIVT
jgi:four helix bundle protein